MEDSYIIIFCGNNFAMVFAKTKETNNIQSTCRKTNFGNVINMAEIIKQFIGKQCIIYTIDSQFIGTIVQAKDGWVKVEGKSCKFILHNTCKSV